MHFWASKRHVEPDTTTRIFSLEQTNGERNPKTNAAYGQHANSIMHACMFVSIYVSMYLCIYVSMYLCLYVGIGQNLVPLVNLKIAGKWMFITRSGQVMSSCLIRGTNQGGVSFTYW